MKLFLYHNTMSAGSRAIRLMMGEYDVDFTLMEEHLWQRREEFLQLNPAATVPVLVENKAVIIGAEVVAEYLDETHGALKRERRLYPEDALQRAEMRRLMNWALVKMETEVIRYIVHERITKRLMPAAQGGGAPDSQALRVSRTNIRYHLQYFDWLISTRNWMAGEQMTQADMTVAAAFSVLDYMGEIEWADYSNLQEWYMRVKSRPSFRPILADRLRGIPPVSHYVDLDF